VLCTDGVGSKMIIAEMANKFDTVPIDMIGMNVNDAICIRAEPVALVDYMAVEDINEDIARDIGKGLNEGLKEANISLIGGETATLPDIVKGIDIAGTVLAIVKKDKIITGKDIKEEDLKNIDKSKFFLYKVNPTFKEVKYTESYNNSDEEVYVPK